MKEIFLLAEIIRKSLDGLISPAEKQYLDEWLLADEKHRILYDDIRREGYLDEKIAEHGIFSVERGYRRFLRDVGSASRRKRLVRWSAAVAILALVAVGIRQFADGVFHRQPDSLITQAHPGTTSAILTFSNGRQIELTDTLNTSFEMENALIEVRSGVVGYTFGEHDANIARHKLTTPVGGEYQLTLSDGTKVWVNAASELIYPAVFAGDSREVELSGEAYFEVAENAGKPFYVKTPNMNIRVTGTSFNVRAYLGEEEQATLVEGSVEVRVGDGDYKLTPGDQLNATGSGVVIEKVKIQPYEIWKHERFIFYNELLENVVRKLERWYGVDIIVADPDVKQYRFTGNVPKYEELQSILMKLELTTRIRFEEKQDAIHVVKDSK